MRARLQLSRSVSAEPWVVEISAEVATACGTVVGVPPPPVNHLREGEYIKRALSKAFYLSHSHKNARRKHKTNEAASAVSSQFERACFWGRLSTLVGTRLPRDMQRCAMRAAAPLVQGCDAIGATSSHAVAVTQPSFMPSRRVRDNLLGEQQRRGLLQLQRQHDC